MSDPLPLGPEIPCTIEPPLRLAPRAAESHKGTYGRVLLIAGSTGMSGAAVLASLAALRSGAGLVQVAVPQPCWPIVAAAEPSFLTLPLPADDAGRISADARPLVEQSLAVATAVAIGPGLGRSSQLTELVRWLFATCPHPLIVDADALRALAELPTPAAAPPAPRVLTPHPGEFDALAGLAERPAPHQRLELATQFAARWGDRCVLVLKGHRTVIADATQSAVNSTGNPGMATGGTGDVLTGVIAALLAQGLSAWQAARLGVYVHGLAGDFAAAQTGEVSLIASDLIAALPRAFQAVALTPASTSL